ncbi:MAG: bifunctional demethylmenaquinone methyltransferase/2-methoxy-6-polyprenyl-1,4-benzoquinol methylase UbiE [Alphaproteobacteria bacterium]|nr:bifunctional demethylmenaquinone methyltransferase/2-methoxy-6-polyprenyl-1,4-benzoquinol methylase UbiE [Alphaproteobacteria bacterium]
MAFFGFQHVEDFVKTDKVKDLFSRVTNSYDVMNDVMSLGVHRLWKNYFIKKMLIKPGDSIVDMASGTGDIAQGVMEQYRFLNLHIMAMDLTESMLLSGKHKAIDKGIIHGIDYTVCDAENLPLPDDSVDVYTCAYGMRNVGNLEKALNEAHRVLKKDGRFYCLEFSAVENAYLKPVYDFYSFQFIPTFGKYIANDAPAYQYLVESIRKFPSQESFKSMLETAGFHNVTFENLSCGITAIHSGKK